MSGLGKDVFGRVRRSQNRVRAGTFPDTKGDTLWDKRESIDFSGQYYSLWASIRHNSKFRRKYINESK